MAENEEQDKSEKATPYKLEEARKKGQVSKSVEVITIVQLTAFSALIIALGPQIIVAFVDELKSIFLHSGNFVFTTTNIFRWFIDVAIATIAIVLPLYLINLTLGIVTSVIQTKPVFSAFPLKPDFKKLNPVNGFKKIFSIKTLFEFIKTLLKIFAVACIFYFVFSVFFSKIQTLAFTSKASLLPSILSILAGIGFLTILILLPISVIDYFFTKWEFAKKMRMSKREVKDEYKKREGHPEVRSKRKELHKELVTKTNALSKVKDSDVIITNPTHIAVALKYDSQKMAAPIVVAKGSGEIAKSIRELGKKYNKTIIRKPELARLLYKKTKIGHAIPEESFSEVAPIYNWLMNNSTD